MDNRVKIGATVVAGLTLISASVLIVIHIITSNVLNKPINELTNEEVVTAYEENVLNSYTTLCETTNKELYGKSGSKGYTAAGNSNWWTRFKPVNNSSQMGVFNSENHSYGVAQQINGVNVLVSGLGFYKSSYIGELYDNAEFNNLPMSYVLKDKEFYKKNKKILQLNGDIFIKFYNDKYPDHNIEATKITNTDFENEYDAVYAYNPSDEQLDKLLEFKVPFMAFYNDWYADSGSYTKLNVTLQGVGSADILASSNKDTCSNSTYFKQSTDLVNIFKKLNNDELVTNITNETVNDICPINVGKASCNFNNIKDSNTDESIYDTYFTPLNEIVNRIKYYDERNINIFDLDGNYDLKYALQYAENIRKEIKYNDLYFRDTNNHTRFFEAIYADRVISYSNPNNLLQNDLGTFSPEEDKVQKLPTINNHIVSKKVTQYDNWFATGIYIKAGQTVTIKREDTTDLVLKFKINFQRDGASRIYDASSADLDENGIVDGKYTRPYTDGSYIIKSLPNGDITLSSPKGGPLYVYVPASTEYNEVSFKANNILLSPYIDEFSEDSINDFINHVNTSPINWLDIATNEVQIHHEKSSFIKFINSENGYNGDLKQLIDDNASYTIQAIYNQAGLLGNDLLSHSDNVTSFCSDFDITDECNDESIHRRGVQHINADRSSCGSLCSGNPYDTNGSYSPIGWGNAHEIGHNLQRGHLKIYGNRSTEVSNNIFPIAVNRAYAINNGDSHYHARYIGESLFNMLKDYNSNNDINTVDINHPLWTESTYAAKASDRLNFYLQLQIATNDLEIFTKLYLLDRVALSYTETEFDAKRSSLGFSDYTYSEFKSLTGEDFMAISLSKISDTNLVSFFNGFGVGVSSKAITQINTNTYSKTHIAGFYKILNADGTKVPVDLLNPTNYQLLDFTEEFNAS